VKDAHGTEDVAVKGADGGGGPEDGRNEGSGKLLVSCGRRYAAVASLQPSL